MGSDSLSFELKGTAVMGQWLILEAVDNLTPEVLSVLLHFVTEIRSAIDAATK